MPDLSDRQREVVDIIPDSPPGVRRAEIGDELGVKPTTAEYHMQRLKEKGYTFAKERDGNSVRWTIADTPDDESEDDTDDTPTAPPIDLDAVDAPDDADPDPDDLTDRQRVLADELKTGATLADLVDRVDGRRPVIAEHVRDLKRQGWSVYHDDTADQYALADDNHLLRSSEHTGTRTRKANRWWERVHNRLQRDYASLDNVPDIDTPPTDAGESLVFSFSDLHVGDVIRRPSDGLEVYNTPIAVGKAEYAARQAIDFADDRGREYDAAWVLLHGDLITNSTIYEGQFEDLDAWLNTQIDAGADAAFRIVSAFAERFDHVNVVCQTGNHGQIRANGSSRQANADLLLYEQLRNIIGVLQTYAGMLENVHQSIGEPGRFYDFEMRGGNVTGHLRHGDDDRAQNDTAAAKRDWRGRALTHDFQVAWIGHHHVFRRLTVDDRDVFVNSSPKPPGDFAEKLGAGGAAAMNPEARNRKIATVHGVNDYGVTDTRAIDTRYYSADYVPDDDEMGIPTPDPVAGAVGPDATDAQASDNYPR